MTYSGRVNTHLKYLTFPGNFAVAIFYYLLLYLSGSLKCQTKTVARLLPVMGPLTGKAYYRLSYSYSLSFVSSLVVLS